jgi:hypothetical protein
MEFDNEISREALQKIIESKGLKKGFVDIKVIISEINNLIRSEEI